MIDAEVERDRREDYRACLTPVQLANLFKGKGEKPVRPEDFFPSLKIDQVDQKTPEVPIEKIHQALQVLRSLGVAK